MTKEEYYNISREQKLPPRCPCLSTCARYRYTAYFIGSTCYKTGTDDIEQGMKRMGILGSKESLENMLDTGESVNMIGGSRSFGIYNACPEFFLHPHEHKLSGMKNLAVHQYSYDEYYRDDKYLPGESRHYTECPEYSLHISKKGRPKNRKSIPLKTRAVLQKEINSKCPFCTNEDVGYFQVHHIDENPENNEHENLIMLCANCHSIITKGDITQEQVIEVKLKISK